MFQLLCNIICIFVSKPTKPSGHALYCLPTWRYIPMPTCISYGPTELSYSDYGRIGKVRLLRITKPQKKRFKSQRNYFSLLSDRHCGKCAALLDHLEQGSEQGRLEGWGWQELWRSWGSSVWAEERLGLKAWQGKKPHWSLHAHYCIDDHILFRLTVFQSSVQTSCI